MRIRFCLLLCSLIVIIFSCNNKEQKTNISREKHAVVFDMDTAIAYPDEVQRLVVENGEYEKFINNCHKFVNVLSVDLMGFKNRNFAEVFDSLSKLSTLEELEIADFDSCQIANNIYKLKHLRVLEIYSEKVYDLPDSISYCSNLEVLAVTNYKMLPKDIYKLKKLRSIEIGDHIKVFPKEILDLSDIENIYIVGELNDVPKDLVKLKKLKELNLHRNPIAEEEKGYFFHHKKYNKLQFIIDQMPQCKLVLDRSTD